MFWVSAGLMLAATVSTVVAQQTRVGENASPFGNLPATSADHSGFLSNSSLLFFSAERNQARFRR